MLIPSDDLHEIDQLQEANLNLQAYERAKNFGPLTEWRGTEAVLLASHLAYALGAPELSARLTSRAWHSDKTDPKAIFYYAAEILQARGPLAGLLFMRKFPDFSSADPKIASWWCSLYGQLYSMLRDFPVAETWHNRALELLPDEPWAWISRSFTLEQQDKYDEALASARKGLELGPHRRSSVSAVAHYLTLLELNDEALALLSGSIQDVENAWMVKHLADLQTEMGMHSEAYTTLQKCFDLLPLLEPKVAEWFYGGLSDSAYLVNDRERAIEYAEKAANPFHTKVRENLMKATEDARRVILDVRFLRQHHVTCAPATISNIARYWKKKADHLDLVEEMCYDGTPSYKERIWAESNGWMTKEFTLNWDDARTLLDRGVPLTLATIYPGGGHLQAIIGYDERRGSFLIRDPYYQRTGEFLAEELLENQKASGPRVMALVPEESREVLEALDKPLLDSDIYDLVYQVESALDSHNRDKAGAALESLERDHPDHRLTLVARWSVSHYDTNTPGLRSALQGLLKQFPDDVNLRLSDISTSAEFTGRLERMKTLEHYSTTKPSDPLIWQMFGYELGLDAKQHRRALHWLFKSIRRSPATGLTYRLMADILWAQRRFEEAAELYRIALSLNDKDEQFAYSYFLAMRHLKREDEAIETLRDRFKRFGKQSGSPACSLFSALRDLSRVKEAFEVLDEAIALAPDDGDLILYAADMKARFGSVQEAEDLVESTREKAPRSKRLRTAARVAQMKGDLAGSLVSWRKILEEDPTATDAHENIAFLMRGLEGADAAKEHLRRACRKYPTNRSLHVLRLQHLNEEPGEAIAVLRDLIRLDSGDIWSWRELSHWYAQVGKFEKSLEAADAAVAIDPNDAVSHGFRGRALELLKRYKDAAEEFRRSIELDVDYVYSISNLVRISRAADAKRSVLDFVWQQLNSQTSTGDAIFTYREEARRLHDRVSLLERLQEYSAANRRSWSAASAVIQQLTDMGRTEEAEKLAIQATERFPLNHQTWLDLALVYRITGDIEKEIEATRNAIAISPVWSFGVQQLADAYQRAGRFDDARDLLVDALTRMPFDNYLLGFLADTYWSLGERDLAIETAGRAVALDPDYEWAWSAIKRWAQETGDRDLPVKLAREMAEKKPKDVKAWINLAEMLSTGAFSQERLDAIETALKIDPFSAQALAVKANVLLDAHRFDDAIEVARTKMPDGHRPEQLRYVEAGIEAQRGHNSRCIDVLVELTESSPDYVPGWLRLADYYRLDDNRNQEYRKVAIEIVRLAPRDAMGFGYLAEACLKLGLRDEAREALQQAVILDPTFDYAVSTLFDMLLDVKDIDGARQLVETLRSSSKDTALPIAVELAIRTADKPATLKAFRELLENENLGRDRIDGVAAKVVDHVGKDKDLYALLRDVTTSGRVNPIAGRYLIDAAWNTGKRKEAEKALAEVAGHSKVWAQAAARFMEWLIGVNPSAVRKFIDQNSEKLASETESWGAVGHQLTNMNEESRMDSWFANWRARENVMPWMLWNYSLLLRRNGRAAEADRINSAALALRYDDTINLHMSILGLAEFNRQNFTEASAIFSNINPGPMTDWDRFFYDTLNEAIWAYDRIQASAIDDAKALIDSMVDRILIFDPKNNDLIVRDLARAAVSVLLGMIGDKWYSFRKKLKMTYYSLG